MSGLALEFDPAPPGEVVRLVTDGLDLYTVAATGLPDYWPVNFFLRSPRREVMGGLLGDVWGGWFRVKQLWIAGPARRQGHGARLLCAAEAYALERGALAATLETFSFQARPFYERQGYEVFATLEDYPPGHTRYYLRKRLAPPA